MIVLQISHVAHHAVVVGSLFEYSHVKRRCEACTVKPKSRTSFARRIKTTCNGIHANAVNICTENMLTPAQDEKLVSRKSHTRSTGLIGLLNRTQVVICDKARTMSYAHTKETSIEAVTHGSRGVCTM